MANLNDDYEDHEEQLGKRFEDLCVDLGIESIVKEEAWDKYKDVSTNYCIDGDQLQWLVCALYECVRKSTTDNINNLDNAYVSLTRLLSASKMSFVQFFHRIRKWADMVKMNEDLRDRIERLESQFSVSAVVFDKYIFAFYYIFQKIDEEQTAQTTVEEKFKVLCGDEELFRFTWILYIKIKTNFPAVCGDVILSFQLLLCTLDWIASNAIVSRSKYLFNPNFKGLPTDFNNRPSKTIDRLPTVLKYICEGNDINYIECKSVRDSFFRHYIEKLLEKEVIKGHESKEDNVLSSINFEFNHRGINNLYGEYMMASGDFDERIYLDPNAMEAIGSVHSKTHEAMLSSDLAPSALRYMQEVINCGNIPGSVETHKSMKGCPGKNSNSVLSGVVSRLNGGVNFNNYDSRVMNSNYIISMLAKRQAAASEELTDMLQTHCFPSPMEEIVNRLEKMSTMFLNGYNCKPVEYKTDLRSLFQKKLIDPSLQRCQFTHKLYYFALENILKSEVSKIELRYKMRSRCSENGEVKLNNIDISALLKKDEFHQALYAMCVEIALVCSDSAKHFPWVLDALELQAVHFYKIIELFMRSVDLPREMVKYFSQVSENIVDSIAWKSESNLWDSLARCGKAPSIDEVTPVERIEQSFKTQPGNKKLIVESNRESRTVTKSSMISGRRLGGGGGQQTMSMNTNSQQGTFRHEDDESARAAAQLVSSGEDDKSSTAEVETPIKTTFTVRHDSLALFFRHMYFLSSVRLRDMCDRLHVNRDLLCKVWTTFEHVVMEETHLLRDRCLDQLIICCVYAVAKAASNRGLSMHEILQIYRMQPQSHRDIYRSVPIDSVGAGGKGIVKDDIGRFYNNIFIPTVHSFVKRFAGGAGTGNSAGGLVTLTGPNSGVVIGGVGGNAGCKPSGRQQHLHQPHLSPMPMRSSIEQLLNSSSRRIASNKNIFVSPAKTQITMSPKRVTFTVSSSPSKELRDINSMIANAASKMKGGLSFGGGSGSGVGSIGGSKRTVEPSFYNTAPSISVLDRTGGITSAKRLRFDQ